MKNSVCDMFNDGFGCPEMHKHDKDPEYCLDCLLNMISEMFEDVEDLKKKLLKKVEYLEDECDR